MRVGWNGKKVCGVWCVMCGMLYEVKDPTSMI